MISSLPKGTLGSAASLLAATLYHIIYPIELEIKDTTDTDRSVSYLDLHLEMDSEGQNETLRQKR
jgi:hypothetical protein